MPESNDHPSQTARGEYCPWWCTKTDHDHLTEYDSSESSDDQVLYRIHARYYGDQALGIVQDEKNDHGVTTMSPVAMHLYGEPESAAEAKQYAEWIEEASDLLDRLESASLLLDAPACTSWCTREHNKDRGWDLINRHANGAEAAVWCIRSVPIPDLVDLEPTVEICRMASTDTATGIGVEIDPVHIRVGALVELSVDQAEVLMRELATAIKVAKS